MPATDLFVVLQQHLFKMSRSMTMYKEYIKCNENNKIKSLPKR